MERLQGLDAFRSVPALLMMFGIKITAGDRMFSLYIRYRDKWTCQRCFTIYPDRSGKLQNSHFWGRGNLSVRHDEENCVALCAGCHQHFTSNPSEHRDFFFKRLGQKRFDLLELRARKPARYRQDDRVVAVGFKMQLEKMGVFIGRGPALL
jgi:hypothetical protein